MRSILDKMFCNKKWCMLIPILIAMLIYLLFVLFANTDNKINSIITLPIISAGASENDPSLEANVNSSERVAGTDTETSFDTVTINRKTRKIYCTRIGAGNDRVIDY